MRLLEARTAQAEAKRTERAIAGIGTSSKTTGKQAAESAGGFDVMTAGAGRLRTALTFVAGAAGLGSVFYGLKDAIRAGQQWQQQQAQLRVALRDTGQSGAASMKMLDNAIAATSTHGGFTPQDEAQGLANFIRLTGSAGKAVALNKEAIDLARGANLSYSQSLRMVSQAQTGSVGRMAKYIGIVQPVTTYTDSMTAAQKRLYPQLYKHYQLLDKLATAQQINNLIIQKYRGSTAAYGRTAAGAISNAEHAFDLLAEDIGRDVLPMVSKAAIWLAGVATVIERNWPGISRVIKATFSPLVNVLRWLFRTKAALIGIGVALAVWATYTAAVAAAGVASAIAGTAIIANTVAAYAQMGAVGALTTVWAELDAAMTANPIGLVVVAIAAVTAGLVFAYTKVKWFRDAVNAVGQFIAAHWRPLATILLFPFVGLPTLVVTYFGKVKSTVLSVVNWIWSKIKWLGDQISSIFKTITGLPGKIFGGIGHFFGSLFHTGGLVKPIRRYASGGFVSGTGQNDSVPAYLTPGEFVMRQEVVRQVGAGNLSAINAGGGLGGLGGMTITPSPVTLMLGQRVLAQGVIQYSLKAAAAA